MTRPARMVWVALLITAGIPVGGCGSANAHGDDSEEHESEEHESEEHESEEHDGEGGDHAHEGDHEEGEHEEEGLHLSPEAMTASEIRIGPIMRRALGSEDVLPAELRFDPSSVAHVAPIAVGRFERVEVALGDRVEVGQILAVVISGSASEAEAQLVRARARLGAAQTDLARQQELVGEGIGARRALTDAEAEVAGLGAEVRGLTRQLRVMRSGRGGRIRLEAPISGVVVQVHATQGENAVPETDAFVIAEPSSVAVYVDVPEMAIRRVQEGAAVRFHPYALPDLAVDGTVQYMAPSLDERTRTLEARVRLESVDPRMRSGMFGGLELLAVNEENRRPRVVPVSSVVTLEGSRVVFEALGEGRFEPRPVRVGRRAGAFYALQEGPAEGTEIVLSGAFTLKSALSTGSLASHEH